MTQLKQVIKDDLGNESDRERKNTRNRESRIARSEEQTVISRMLP